MTADLLTRLIEAGTPATLVAEVAMLAARADAAGEAIEKRRAVDRDCHPFPPAVSPAISGAGQAGFTDLRGLARARAGSRGLDAARARILASGPIVSTAPWPSR